MAIAFIRGMQMFVESCGEPVVYQMCASAFSFCFGVVVSIIYLVFQLTGDRRLEECEEGCTRRFGVPFETDL